MGRPDIVAVRDGEGGGIGAKTGLTKPGGRAQIALDLWALPEANRVYAKVRFRGRVEYKCRFGIVEPEEVDAEFASRVAELMKAVCGPDPPRKSPSFKECQFCSLTPKDSANRVEEESVCSGVTDEF